MEDQANYTDQFENQFNSQAPVPNATTILILGIASIVTCCCYGIIGIICGIIALNMAKTAKETYETNPGLYTENSYKNVNTGRTCAIIGLILSGIYTFMTIVMVAISGIAALTNPGNFINSLN